MRVSIRGILFFCTCIFLAACQRNAPEPRKTAGVPTAFVLDTRLAWKTDDEMMLEIDIAALTEDCVDFTVIPDSAFHIENTSSVNFEIDTVERIYQEMALPYSTILLVNQSESPMYYDLSDFRVRAVNRFFLESSWNTLNQASIAYFARNSNTISNYEIYTDSSGNPFGGSYQEKVLMEYEIANEEISGTSNLYDACLTMMQFLDTFAVNDRRSITVYTYNIDDLNGISMAKLIDSAISHNVSINLISVGNTLPQFADICSKTGGFLMQSNSTYYYEYQYNGPLMIASLDRILKRNLHVYRIHLHLKRNYHFYNGFYLRPDMRVRYNDSAGTEVINSPLKFYYRLSL